MITTPTVFVIGAGASKPFEFPSGFELAEFLSSFGTFGELIACGFDQGAIITFRDALKNSGRGSVDAFLEHHPELLDVGKAAIAYRLVMHERPDILMRFSDNWYRSLFGKLDAPLDRFHQNRVSFITFNYDRSLEQFLFTALRNSYRGSDEDVVSAVTSLPIIHLHGQMGLLDGQPEQVGVTKRRAYTNELSPDSLKTAAEGIRIVHEIDARHMPPFLIAHDLLLEAKQIFFIGFGYAATNLKRLGWHEVLAAKNASVASTFCGETPARQDVIRRTFFPGIELETGNEAHSVLPFLNHSPMFQQL